MFPVDIFYLGRCLKDANNIKEDSVMGKEEGGIECWRYVRNKTILRKKLISNSVYGLDWYRHDGQYSKEKIHCGCGLCKFGKKRGLPIIRDMREKILMDNYR